MRIRLSLTLDLDRSPKPEEHPIRPDTESLVEHAGDQPMGFRVEPHERWKKDDE